MSCGCNGCIPRQTLCMGRGNSKRFLFSVLDSDGDEFDVSSAAAIEFVISDGVWLSGNLGAGGIRRVVKSLTAGGVTIAGTGYQFAVDVTPADTGLLVNENNYWDVTVTNSAGGVYTVSAGIFRVIDTSLGDE